MAGQVHIPVMPAPEPQLSHSDANLNGDKWPLDDLGAMETYGNIVWASAIDQT